MGPIAFLGTRTSITSRGIASRASGRKVILTITPMAPITHAAETSKSSSIARDSAAPSVCRASWRLPPPRDPNNLRTFADAAQNRRLLWLLATNNDFSRRERA